jgi:hypothetical protein
MLIGRVHVRAKPESDAYFIELVLLNGLFQGGRLSLAHNMSGVFSK